MLAERSCDTGMCMCGIFGTGENLSISLLACKALAKQRSPGLSSTHFASAKKARERPWSLWGCSPSLLGRDAAHVWPGPKNEMGSRTLERDVQNEKRHEKTWPLFGDLFMDFHSFHLNPKSMRKFRASERPGRFPLWPQRSQSLYWSAQTSGVGAVLANWATWLLMGKGTQDFRGTHQDTSSHCVFLTEFNCLSQVAGESESRATVHNNG